MVARIKEGFHKFINYIRELGSLTPIALVMAVMPIVGSSVFFYFFGLQIGTWLRDNWQIGSVLFFLGIIFFCGLSLLPTNVIGLISGWSFGFGFGIVVLMAGIVCASTVSFLINRRLSGDKLPHVFENHPKAQAVYQALIGQGTQRAMLIVFLLRLSPAMPFALTNFLMASARVPLRSFIGGTMFGMLPRSSAVVFVGSGLSELSFDDPQEAWLIIFGIAATIVSVILITVIARRALDHLTKEKPAM